MQEAKECVKRKFDEDKGFENCKLIKLSYDEGKSNKETKSFMTTGGGVGTDIKAENVIVLISEFKTDPSLSTKTSNFIPNTTYEWNWILVRDEPSEQWKIRIGACKN